MSVNVTCPGCAKTITVSTRYLTRLVTCVKCWCVFVPVEDTGVHCPRCGTVTMVPYGAAGRSVPCLSCGFVFGEKLIPWLVRSTLYIAAGVAAFTAGVTITIMTGAYVERYLGG